MGRLSTTECTYLPTYLPVSTCSETHPSRLLWSVMTEIGLFPIHVSYLQRADTMAYAFFSRGVHCR